MIFRVGAKPLSNRSVHKIHEDCEVGAGNNPENSAVKGNPTLLRATDGQANPENSAVKGITRGKWLIALSWR
ncbi:MAG: hypothetical protein U1E78_10205 [Gammaproteobacteria bacterium]